jgi:hypothetical protein
MMERFSGNCGGGGFFFTLNQDLYVERYFSSSNTALHHPHINNNVWSIGDKEFGDGYYIMAPKEPLQHPESLKVSHFHYIKLHGSFNWKRSDETNMMVIGQDKESRIAEEPLLSLYSSIFKNVLYQNGVRLLVIGYSFADNHINKVIANAMKDYGLTLVVVAPWPPAHFMQILSNLSDNKPGELSQNYYPFNKTLSALFLPNDDTWKRIRDILFS